MGDTYPTNDDVASWLSAYIPKAPVPPGGGNYRYAQLDGNDTDTNPGDSYAIWDPNPYGGKYFAAGPGGAIGEDSDFETAVQKATGQTVNNLDPDEGGVELSW